MGPTHQIKEDFGDAHKAESYRIKDSLISHGTSITSDVVEDPDFQDSLPNQSCLS